MYQKNIVYQTYDLQKLMFQLTPSGPIPFGTSSPMIKFLYVYVLSMFLHDKNPFDHYCKIVQKTCSHHISSQREYIIIWASLFHLCMEIVLSVCYLLIEVLFHCMYFFVSISLSFPSFVNLDQRSTRISRRSLEPQIGWISFIIQVGG